MCYRSGDEILEAFALLGGTCLGRSHQGWGYVNRGAHKSILAAPRGTVAVLLIERDARTGVLVEYGSTQQIFGYPEDARTRAYVTGRVG